jgi:small GTP-binding protein
VRLAETVGRWLGRVEVVLGGAELPLREGEEALVAGEPGRARAAAHEILARVPGSPLGLALLADACEMAGLEAEHAMALEELSQRVPSRADVWVRLGRARAATGGAEGEIRDAYLRALGVAEPGGDARREALLALADLDLAQTQGGAERAELWLERVTGDRAPDVALRRAEVRLARADAEGALAELGRIEIGPTEGRANLALGRAKALRGDPEAFGPLLRAAILDVPGASEALSSALGWIPSDDATRARVRGVIEARGESELARFRAAFARAEGRRDEARGALLDAVRAGESGAARPLLDAALEDHDAAALATATEAIDAQTDGAAKDATLRDARRLVAILAGGPSGAEQRRGDALLDGVATLSNPRAIAWGAALREELAREWVPEREAARWEPLLGRLEQVARALHDLESSALVAGLSAERRRPLRLAVVGEFNAGKSTFINALVGQEIAPMGVLPTTATLHHLRYAPDPIARILFRIGAEPPERIASVLDLRAVLKSIDAAEIRRVEILLPIASLTRVEILDTPGFNAPDSRHTDAARRAFEEADAAIWLLDAGQPMKRSERQILDEARAARLPVQVLVNKADRLSGATEAAAENRARVLRSVNEGLAETGLASWSPPLLVSARRALAGKLGDAQALAESGWGEVEAMLEREFVARSEELKERALRRRALAIVAKLGRAAAQAADEERATAEAARHRVEALGHAAARIDRDVEGVAARIAEGMVRPAAAWKGELAIVVAGRSLDGIAGDLSLQRYRVERALAHLARPIAQALAGAADGTGIAPTDLAPIARASVRAFASVASENAPLLPLARSAVASLVEHLATAAASPPPLPRAAGLVGELSSFAAALG